MPRPQRFFLFKIKSIIGEITGIEVLYVLVVSYEKCRRDYSENINWKNDQKQLCFTIKETL